MITLADEQFRVDCSVCSASSVKSLRLQTAGVEISKLMKTLLFPSINETVDCNTKECRPLSFFLVIESTFSLQLMNGE